MALITFTNDSSITVEVPANRRWSLPATGRAGTATFSIPHYSAASSTSYIDKDFGSRIQIVDKDGGGIWTGYITNLKWNSQDRSLDVQAQQEYAILNKFPVDLNRKFSNLSIGAIVSAALSYQPVPVLAVAETPPNIEDDYWFHGETVWSHIRKMMSRSNGELRYNDDGQLYWSGPTGNLYGTLLSAPGILRNSSYEVSFRNQATRVTALANWESVTVIDGTAASRSEWAGHKVLKVAATGTAELNAAAQSEINRSKAAQVRITGSVPRANWDLREGDFVQGYHDYANFTGEFFDARVVSRTINDASDLMQIELDGITTPEPTTIRPDDNIFADNAWNTARHAEAFQYIGGWGERSFFGRD